MQSQIDTQNISFESCIYKYCGSDQTGTILIATHNNKSCQISIENGDVIAASLGRSKGYQVAKELLNDGIRSASFIDDLKFPHTGVAEIHSSQLFLEKLANIPHLKLVKS